LPPNWASPSAFPISRWTGAGKARKSRFDEPIQSSGFSPMARRARMKISQNGDKRNDVLVSFLSGQFGNAKALRAIAYPLYSFRPT
jgi:hypothetical protein